MSDDELTRLREALDRARRALAEERTKNVALQAALELEVRARARSTTLLEAIALTTTDETVRAAIRGAWEDV